MKLKIATIFTAIILAAIMLFPACTPASTGKPADGNCRVVLEESRYYSSAEYIKEVLRGDDAVFTLKFANGYTFGSASYGNYDVETSSPDENGIRTALLTLHGIKYPSFVSVEVEKVAPVYTVSVNEAPEFRCGEPALVVAEGESATFTLWFDGAYTFESAYSENGEIRYHVTGIDGEVDENNERRIVLTVEDINENTVITVTSRSADGGEIQLKPDKNTAVIGYGLNGGEYINNDLSGLYYTVNYPLAHYPRPNTSIGTDVIKRNGYTLTGWNTEADGSGEHIGLGSRVTVAKGETLLLYAEWAQWSDKELFDFVLINRNDAQKLYTEKRDKEQKLKELVENSDPSAKHSVVITAYHGSLEKLVIPAEIDGCAVEVIAPTTALRNAQLKTVIFPDSTFYIMERAFLHCENLSEIYLFDNLHYIDYNAFGSNSPLETLHINAKLAPIYGENESAQFANKMEMIMKPTSEPRTIIFGSCSTWYGIIAEDFGVATGRTAFNMGVEGDTCTLIQCDIIRQYMQDGDTLIYICDLGSPYLWGYDVSFDPRVYRMMEFNYDLLATVNMQRYSSVLSALNEYLIIKNRTTEGGSYEDYNHYITEYGDLTTERNNENPSGEYEIITKNTLEQNKAFEKTKEILQSFSDMGIDIYYAMSTVCDTSVAQRMDEINAVNDFLHSAFADEELNIPAKLMRDLLSSVLPSEYFYETYRLSRKGAEYFTPLFIENFLSASA